jgi:isochorismate synthase EntC
VAGSAPRGRSPEEDDRLGTALRESKKEQEEHAAVVRALREALAPLCVVLDVPEAPRLLRVEGIQHLETPIAGTLRDDAKLFELAGRLHPTPAVAGAPREAALAWLAEHEALVRGWYGGGVGFLDAAGGGELCAGLRSALVCGSDARLYAGAGIVAASDPEAELVETRLKLRALLLPLLEL